MKTYDQPDPGPESVRSHPWTETTSDSDNRYWDFKKNPELIRTSLEDFVPWSTWRAVERFYDMVEWLNGTGSVLESNDCAFEGPSANQTPQFAKILESSGRLMILWRDLSLNLVRDNIDQLKGNLHVQLNETDPELEFGVVGMTVFPVRYTTLPDPKQLGFQLTISFWAWGDDDTQVMANLDRTISGIDLALRTVAS